MRNLVHCGVHIEMRDLSGYSGVLEKNPELGRFRCHPSRILGSCFHGQSCRWYTISGSHAPFVSLLQDVPWSADLEAHSRCELQRNVPSGAVDFDSGFHIRWNIVPVRKECVVDEIQVYPRGLLVGVHYTHDGRVRRYGPADHTREIIWHHLCR